jgi:hypothetical protein
MTTTSPHREHARPDDAATYPTRLGRGGTPPMKPQSPRRALPAEALGLVGAGIWLLALIGSLAGMEWVQAWFYQLAWWGYIILIDALVARRTGSSLLRDRPRDFVLLAWVSVSFWLAWEIVNLRLHNWHYVGVARETLPRWAGAFIAYATVLPGVHLTQEFLRALGLKLGSRVRPIPSTRAWYPWFLTVGVIFIFLPLLWPWLFFPLVWGALVFLLEPLNHYHGAPSFMASWERGDISPFLRWLAAGLLCGIFWESWNWLAGARWAYTIPWLAEPKLFAMPLAGYLGFPPFGLECAVFMNALTLVRLPKRLGWSLAAALLPFDLWALHLMDTHLYMEFAP